MSPQRIIIIQAGSDLVAGWVCLLVSCYLFLFEDMFIIPLLIGTAAVVIAGVPPILRNVLPVVKPVVWGAVVLTVAMTIAGFFLVQRNLEAAQVALLFNYLLAVALLIYVMSCIVNYIGALLEES